MKIENIKNLNELSSMMKLYNLKIEESKISLFGTLKKYFGLEYDFDYIIGNDILNYKVTISVIGNEYRIKNIKRIK